MYSKVRSLQRRIPVVAKRVFSNAGGSAPNAAGWKPSDVPIFRVIGLVLSIPIAGFMITEFTPRDKVLSLMEMISSDFYKLPAPQGEITEKVYMDIKFESQEEVERIVIGLYGKDLPITTSNFKHLCVGDKKFTNTEIPLHYKASAFHRIIPGFMIQGGDYVDSSGLHSFQVDAVHLPDAVKDSRFADESFMYKHNGLGVVSMANCGPNTNGSQFFICTGAVDRLDDKHVVFGQVLEGAKTVRKIEWFGGNLSGKPQEKIKIVDCGLLKEE